MSTATETYTFVLDDKFFSDMESVDIRGGLVESRLDVTRRADIYYFQFVCEGYINILCDRCLDEMRHEVDAEYNLTVKYGDHFCDDDDELLILGPDDTEVDVSRMLHDTVALSIPLMHHHPDGECNEEMTALLLKHQAADGFNPDDDDNDNDDTNHCGIDPRWEVLQKLKDK